MRSADERVASMAAITHENAQRDYSRPLFVRCFVGFSADAPRKGVRQEDFALRSRKKSVHL
jgi:hypothetical protein